MERRAFLALLASAPIAALAPLPKVLEQNRLHGYFLAFDHVPQTMHFTRVYDANLWDVTPDTMRTLTQYSNLIQREVASETLGADSLYDYLIKFHRTNSAPIT